MENLHETPQTRLENLAEKLRARGQRLTPQRMAVLKIIANSAEHPDIEQIYTQVKEDFPMTSLATIYKTLDTLKEIGEVREMGFCEGSNRYDGLNTAPHPHLICVKCSKIIDAEVANLEALAEKAAEQSGYQIMDQRLDFFGVCPDCQSKE